MRPIVTVPETIRIGMAPYREVCCREAGFEHVSRYVTGVILSPKKTLQGIYDTHVWHNGVEPSHRAMHAAVCEAAWDLEGLRPLHRQVVGPEHRGRGREVVGLDWTSAHHDRGPHIWGVKRRWDHVEKRQSLYQTVLSAVVANRERIDGIDVVVQPPTFDQEEVAYLQATVQASYEQMEAVRSRLLELRHHLKHRQGDKKRTEMAWEMVAQLESAGHFPQANYAFDNGLVTVELARVIENVGTHWVSEQECSRHIPWQGQWRRVDAVAQELRREHPESCRPSRCDVATGKGSGFGPVRRWCASRVMDVSAW